MSIEEYADLATTGYQGGSGEQTPPEEDFFHSVYIAGKTRKNHINITEESGKYQVRGVEYNLDNVHMIITHTKEILAHIKREQNKDNIKCFCFKDSAPPWYGTSKLGDGSARQCPQTSAERAVNDFCNPCRAQILVAGIYCTPEGSPILTEEKKPIFVFIRGKGMRYSNVSEYLNDLYKEDLSPIFEPVTDQSAEFEKTVVNNKRFVTKLSKGSETSSYGNDVNVFVLERGVELPKDFVLSILQLSKKTVDQFNDKFNWAKGKQTTGYGGQAAAVPEGVLSTEGDSGVTEQTNTEPVQTETSTEDKAAEAGAGGKTFSFDDINF